MTDYTNMTGEERFAALDRMAQAFYGTARWKTEFCRRYGITPQATNVWKDKGAPVWAAQAMHDALTSQTLTRAVQAIREADISGLVEID